MQRKSLNHLAALFLAACLHGGAFAGELEDGISDLGHRWAKVYYQTPDSDKEAAYRSVITQARQLAESHPGKAEPLVWQAILLSSQAKAAGGLGALSKVNEARDLLLSAERINPTVLDGSVYNSLGSLYAKVPGWPIGFGDKKKAREYLEKALSINPNGIDPNYFYGELLADQGEYAKAVLHLKRALGAPPRPGRDDADAGRRKEANQLLAAIQQKHGDHLTSQ